MMYVCRNTDSNSDVIVIIGREPIDTTVQHTNALLQQTRLDRTFQNDIYSKVCVYSSAHSQLCTVGDAARVA
jgi:hypothetical protein